MNYFFLGVRLSDFGFVFQNPQLFHFDSVQLVNFQSCIYCSPSVCSKCQHSFGSSRHQQCCSVCNWRLCWACSCRFGEPTRQRSWLIHVKHELAIWCLACFHINIRKVNGDFWVCLDVVPDDWAVYLSDTRNSRNANYHIHCHQFFLGCHYIPQKYERAHTLGGASKNLINRPLIWNK